MTSGKPKHYRSMYVDDSGNVCLDRSVKVSVSIPRALYAMILAACRRTYMRPSNLISALINVHLKQFVDSGDADRYLKGLTPKAAILDAEQESQSD